MNFISYEFILAFLPLTLILYYLCRKAVSQNLVLLFGSFVFYGFYGAKNLPVLASCILLTYFGGRIGRKLLDEGKASGKAVLVSTLVLNLLILCVFKYTGFLLENINRALNFIFIKFNLSQSVVKLFLPVGLSFYIFQSSTYLIDLLRGQVEAEHSLITYGAFVSFFPTIISGPILKSKDILSRFQQKRSLSFYNFQIACIEFIYGAFLKKVIADRIALFTDAVYADVTKPGGGVLLVCAILYSLQIYTDFFGYSCMAAAVGRLLGFRLPDNFLQPYFATSMQDFWHRWHISLSSWFTRYLYIPLGGSRCGLSRQNLNILIVFLVSGLWHGADWSFVLWGGLHALFLIFEKLFLKKSPNTKSVKLLRILYADAASTFAWVFFRAENIWQGGTFIKRIFTDFQPWTLVDGTLLKYGLSGIELNILLFSLLVMFVVSLFREKGKTARIMFEPWWARYGICFFLFFMIVIFGMYGPEFIAENFIYAGF